MQKEEMGQIKSLWNSQKKYHKELSDYFSPFYDRYTFESRMEGLYSEDGEVKIIVARMDGSTKPVGYLVVLLKTSNVGEICSMFVEPDCRSMGIGGKMFDCANKWFEEKAVKDIETTVSWHNFRAIKFYEKIGLKPFMTSMKMSDS